MRGILGAGVAAGVVLAGCTAGGQTEEGPGAGGAETWGAPERGVLKRGVVERGVVERVVDGDTLRVRVAGESRRVRLIGVDAPETHEPRECWAAESAARLAELTPAGSAVRLTTDREPRDRYGRDLRYVMNVRDVAVNATLVADGAAVAIEVEPNTARWDTLLAAERAARTARRGGWGGCPSGAPPWSAGD